MYFLQNNNNKIFLQFFFSVLIPGCPLQINVLKGTLHTTQACEFLGCDLEFCTFYRQLCLNIKVLAKCFFDWAIIKRRYDCSAYTETKQKKLQLILSISESDSAYTEYKRNRIWLILILLNSAYIRYELKSISTESLYKQKSIPLRLSIS